MQAKPLGSWFNNCRWFLKRQVEIVAPAVLVPMGERANYSVRKAFNLPPKKLRPSVEDSIGDQVPNGPSVLAVYHCGNRTINRHRKIEQQLLDWARIGRALEVAE